MLPRWPKITPVTNITISMTIIMKSAWLPLKQVYLFSMTSAHPRRPMHFLLLGLGLVLILFAVYCILQDVPPPSDLSAVPAQVNYVAPDLTLTDLQGITHSLTDYRGQVVLINLWATWCPPCKEEMPILQAYYKNYVEAGFVLIAINDGDPTPDVKQFVQDYQLTFPIWLDPTYTATEQAFKTLNLPSSFVIDREGTIRLRWVGGISRRMLDKHVTPLIMENQ
jgi:cytochrome c biogenesis protein CcmG, thiol:disulfide interchange protein DsbE